jgi:hypothetical protein
MALLESLPFASYLDGSYEQAADLMAALALLKLNEAAPLLLQTLERTRDHERTPEIALRALADLAVPASFDALLALMEQPEYRWLVGEIVWALCRIDRERAGRELAARLKQSEPEVQILLCSALGTLRSASAISELRLLLKKPKTKVAALVALVRIGDNEAVDGLASNIAKDERDPDPIELLREVGSRELALRLIESGRSQAWAGGWSKRKIALLGVAYGLGVADAAAELDELSKNPLAAVRDRWRAATELLRAGDNSQWRFLLSALTPRPNDPDAWENQKAAVEAIRALGDCANHLPEERLAILDALHGARRHPDKDPSTSFEMSKVILALTGTERFSEYEMWREKQAHKSGGH